MGMFPKFIWSKQDQKTYNRALEGYLESRIKHPMEKEYTSKHYTVLIRQLNSSKGLQYILSITAKPLRSKSRASFHYKQALTSPVQLRQQLLAISSMFNDLEFTDLVAEGVIPWINNLI